MNRIWLDNKGYSLLELLLVLIIIMVISSSSIYLSNRYIEKLAFDLFFNQLVLDARQVQLTAVEEGRSMKLIFEKGGTRYTGRKSIFEPIMVRHLPDGYTLSQSSHLTELSFHPNGAIEKFGTLTFNTPTGLKLVRVYIGKGRMSLE